MSPKKLKKNLQEEVAQTLLATFSKFNDKVSPKKFKRNIKKATKALLAGVKVTPEENSTVQKATKKKEKAVVTSEQ